MKEAVRGGDCVGRGRGPGSRQWCTNCSEVGGLWELLGDGLSYSGASSRCDPRVGG